MKKIICILLIFITIFSTGCLKKNESAETKRNYLVYNLGELPENLMLLSGNTRQMDLLFLFFDGLVNKDKDGQIVPGIAQSWTIGDNGISYIFNLRDDAKWSDGKTINAEDFVNFFSEILKPGTDNVYAKYLYYIFGAEDYNLGKKNFDNVAVRAVDSDTLEIRLNTPYDNFLNILSEPFFKLRKGEEYLKNWKKDYKLINYTGPFVVKSISDDGEVELTKNTNYYDAYQILSDKIVITSIKDSEKALAAFNTSKIDIFAGPPYTEVRNLLDSGKAVSNSEDGIIALNFNMKNSKAASSLNFRKAVALSINKEIISDNILDGSAAPAYVYLPPGNQEDTVLAEDAISNSYNSDDAKKLLESSTYNNETIKLVYEDNVKARKISEEIAEDVKSLGITVKTIPCSEEELEDRIITGEYDMALTESIDMYDSPEAFLEEYVSAAKKIGYRNSELDLMLSEINIQGSKGKRMELIRNSENILTSNLPIIPVAFNNIVLCIDKDVDGAFITSSGYVNITRAYKKNSS